MRASVSLPPPASGDERLARLFASSATEPTDRHRRGAWEVFPVAACAEPFRPSPNRMGGRSFSVRGMRTVATRGLARGAREERVGAPSDASAQPVGGKAGSRRGSADHGSGRPYRREAPTARRPGMRRPPRGPCRGAPSGCGLRADEAGPWTSYRRSWQAGHRPGDRRPLPATASRPVCGARPEGSATVNAKGEDKMARIRDGMTTDVVTVERPPVKRSRVGDCRLGAASSGSPRCPKMSRARGGLHRDARGAQSERRLSSASPGIGAEEAVFRPEVERS